MKADISRVTFNPAKHYGAVHQQQGRVQLDADWNEQSDIIAHRVETEARDVIGTSGAPLHEGGFRIVQNAGGLTADEKKNPGNANPPSPGAGDFLITAGRMYVDGILCENDVIAAYTSQPDFQPSGITAGGNYVVYLDVWQREITAREDADIREIALGGPDTTTRSKTVWQVKTWFAGSGAANCATDLPAFNDFLAAPNGTMSATTKAPNGNTDVCSVPPGAGYRGLENQFYRVELHDSGSAVDVSSAAGAFTVTTLTAPNKIVVSGGTWQKNQAVELVPTAPGADPMRGLLAYVTDVQGNTVTINADVSGISAADLPVLRPAGATFKWSRDNGSVVTTITKIDGANITITDFGRDDALGFAPEQWVEVTDDKLELERKPGQLARIVAVNAGKNLITLSNAVAPLATTADGVAPEWHPKLRRWEGVQAVKFSPTASANVLDLERGIQVSFSIGNFRTGDYWTFAARTATEDAQSGNIDWPKDVAGPKALPPFGIRHHYCRLGILNWTGTSLTVADCRPLFPPVTELTSLRLVAGDGQEAMPNKDLEKLLQVGVFNGSAPVTGARIRFTADANGRLAQTIAGLASATSNTLPMPAMTGTDGIASCAWRLDPNRNLHTQQLKAELLNANNDPLPQYVVFTATLSIAEQVFYDPGQCNALSGQDTVHKAIRRLAELVSLSPLAPLAQDLMPGEALVAPKVLVSSACGPRTDGQVRVRFTVTAGGGTVNGANSIDVAADANGQATCTWALDEQNADHEVEAAIVPDPATFVTAAPTSVKFRATLSLASHVSYDRRECPNVPDSVRTVADALNWLCTSRRGDGCGIVVGRGSQNERLDRTLAALLDDDKTTDICICLLPGEHALPPTVRPRSERPVNIRIHGCVGSTIVISEKPVTIVGLASIRFGDLAMSGQKTSGMLVFQGCADIGLQRCSFVQSDALWPLVRILGASTVRIQDCDFVSLYWDFVSVREITALRFPPINLGRMQDVSQLLPRVVPMLLQGLLRATPNDRKLFLEKYARAMEQADIPADAKATITAAARLLADINAETSQTQDVVIAANRAVYSQAILFGDMPFENLMENNRIFGEVSFYGSDGRLSDGDWAEIVKSFRAGAVRIAEPLGRAVLRGNILQLLTLDAGVKKLIQNGALRRVYETMLLCENSLLAPNNQLLASHCNLSSNQFLLPEVARAGAVAADSAVFVGNRGPAKTVLGYAVPQAPSVQVSANLISVSPV